MSASTTSPRTRTGSTTAPTASPASTPARRGWRRWTRSCASAGSPAHEEEIVDKNNGHNHEAAFVKIIEKKGTLDESLLLQESYAPGVKGKLIPKPSAIKGLVGSIPTAIRGIRSGKMRSLPKLIPGVHEKLPDGAQDNVKRIFSRAEESRIELNLYISGEEEVEPEPDEEEWSQPEVSPGPKGNE